MKKQKTTKKKKTVRLSKVKKPIQKERKIRIDERKINELIKIDDIEEFYYFINILNEPQTERFILHYKKTKEKNGNKISSIVHRVNSKKDLIKTLEQEIVAHLKERYDSIISKIREERKKGKDVTFEWIKSMSVPLKIKIYEATLEKKDFYKTKKLLDDLELQLKNVN